MLSHWYKYLHTKPRSNLKQRLKLGGSSQLHGEKGLEGTIFHNANTLKRNSNAEN